MPSLPYRSCSKAKTVRVRYTPTFYHVPIFDQACQENRNQPKYSDTWHSRVFQSIENVNQPSHKPEKEKEEDLKKKQKKQANKMSHVLGLSHHQLLWYDPEKEFMLKDCQNFGRFEYAKERKLVQLASCPFYYDDDRTSEHNEDLQVEISSKKLEKEEKKTIQNKQSEKQKQISIGNVTFQESKKQQTQTQSKQKDIKNKKDFTKVPIQVFKAPTKQIKEITKISRKSQPRPAFSSLKSRNKPVFMMLRKPK